MRFQQLKKSPNAILKKRLYKSGKNWIIKSSLSFASGLVLFGATQVVNVSADTPTSNTSTQENYKTQTSSDNTENTSDPVTQRDPNDTGNTTTQNNSADTAKTVQNNSNSTNNAVSNNDPTNSEKTTDQNTSNISTDKSTAQNNTTGRIPTAQNQNVQINNTNTSLSQATQTYTQSDAKTNVETNETTTPTTSTQADTQPDSQDANIPYKVYELGTGDYYVDDNKVLHVTAGELSEKDYQAQRALLAGANKSTYSIFAESNVSYKTISFDGKFVVHGDISYFFGSTFATTIENLQNFDTSDATNFTGLFYSSYLESLDLSKLNLSKATTLSKMFAECQNLKTVNTRDASGKIIDTSNVTDFSKMFDDDEDLESLDVSGLDTSKATDLSWMFDRDVNLESIDVSGFDTSNVTNMGYMFGDDEKISYLDVSNFDTSKVTTINGIFHHLGSDLTDDFVNIKGLENWDTSNVTNMSGVFLDVNFDPTGLKKWDTSKVTNMSTMFQNSQISGKLDLSNFVGDSLITISQMFMEADKLTEIDLSGLNTPNLVDLSTPQSDGTTLLQDAAIMAFENCSNLQKVDLSKFDGSKVNNYNYMFDNCPKLTTIIWPNVSTASATDMSGMFERDISLTPDNVDFLKQFDTSKVTNFSYMFEGCSGLTTIKQIENWDVSSATDMGDMLDSNKSLTSLDLSHWTINKIKRLYSFLHGDDNLTNLKLPVLNNPVNQDINFGMMLNYCDNLHFLDFTNFVMPPNAERQNMLSATNHLYKLILNSKSNLYKSNLSYFDIYKGWYNVGTGTDDDPEGNLVLHDGDQMMSTYSNDKGPNETWVIAERKFIDYKIEYFDFDTLQPLDSSYDISGTSREGWPVNIPTLADRNINLPGYDNTINYDFDDDNESEMSVDLPLVGTPESKNLVYKVRVKVADPLIIKINGVSDPIILRLNDPDAIKDNAVLNNLDNTKQLDPDKTTVSSGSASMTENQLYDQLHLNYAKTLKSFIDDLLKYDLAVDGEVEVSGELDVNPSYLPDQNKPGNNGSGGTTDNKIVQKISQTIATFSDRPSVDLYDFNGNLISHKILRTNTDWQSDEEMSLNDINYYRVSEDEWVKASDVYVYVEDHTKVRTYKDSKAQLKNAHMDNTRTLDPSTDWKVDRYVMTNGEKYYRVSTNEFLPVDKAYEYHNSTKIVHSRRATPVYDERGNNVGRTLKSDKDYKTDKLININGEEYYRVAVNEFVKASDID